MVPLALSKLAPLLASLHLVVATLPSGDIERTAFREELDGVHATVEHTSVRTGERTVERRLLPRGHYGWHIDEEHRSVIAAEEGHPTGVVRRAFVLSAWVDATPNPNVAPHPVEAFSFYAPTREAAEELRERLKKALSVRR